MKAKELIALFTPKERRLFEQTVIKTHKRKSLQNLYTALKKEATVDKVVLYKRVFGKPYQEKKDAALRNELRLLSNAIELFWVQQRQLSQLDLQQFDTKYYLLQVYAERLQWNLFDQLWQRLYKSAVQQQEHLQQIQLLQLWVKEKMLIQENSTTWFNEMKQLLEQAQVAVLNYCQELYYRLQVKQGFVERNLYALNPRYNPQLPPFLQLSNKPASNQKVLHHLQLVAEGYILHGTDKIQQLEKALAYEEYLKEHSAYQDLYQSTFAIRANIAIEYFLQKQYHKADAAYKMLLPRLGSLSHGRQAAIYFNYLVNLICLERYQKALEVYAHAHSIFSSSDRFKYRALYFQAWCYILMEDYSQALDAVLESKPHERPEQDSVYGRVLLSILYSMLDELELAERELYNLKQKHQYSALEEPFLIECTKLFYRFAQIRFLPPSDKKRHRIEQLRQEMQQEYGSSDNTTSSTLMLRWFERVSQALLEEMK